MRLVFTKNFIRDYRNLPPPVQKAIDKQLEFLLSDSQHPSLHIKKMQDPRNIWEGRVSGSYRFTFQVEGDTYIMRKIGSHDILKKP